MSLLDKITLIRNFLPVLGNLINIVTKCLDVILGADVKQ